jgi:hypothetical protein
VQLLQDACDEERGLLRDDEALAFEEVGAHDRVGDAVSSSRLRKTKPLAVPGRWRQMTAPAMVMRWPWRPAFRSQAARHAAGAPAGAPSGAAP